MSKVLEVKELSKTYHNGCESVEALKEVSMHVKKSELLAVMGSSGSGKSSLLHILGALDKPDSGKIYLNGILEKEYCVEPKATQIRGRNIGFIFQQFNLMDDLTVKENIQLPLILSGKLSGKYEKRIIEMMDKVGLKGKDDFYPNELSGGQQQRVAIARAMVGEPKILLADEPTGNLDYNTATDTIELICKMSKERNQCIIIVTHDPRIATYADRVIFLHNGRVKSEVINKKCKQDYEIVVNEFQKIACLPA